MQNRADDQLHLLVDLFERIHWIAHVEYSTIKRERERESECWRKTKLYKPTRYFVYTKTPASTKAGEDWWSSWLQFFSPSMLFNLTLVFSSHSIGRDISLASKHASVRPNEWSSDCVSNWSTVWLRCFSFISSDRTPKISSAFSAQEFSLPFRQREIKQRIFCSTSWLIWIKMDNEGVQLEEMAKTTPDKLRKQSRARQDSAIDLWATVDRSRLEQDVHIVPIEELYNRFHTNPRTGLPSSSIEDARAQYGENKLTPPKQPSYIWLLFKELFMGFNCILWFAGVLAFLAYKPFGEPTPSITNLALGVVLFLVITCNSILNVYQQLKSIKIVAAFSKLLPTLATVRRDGGEQQVVTSELVPGDIILIRMGDKLPADCRFIASDGLKVRFSCIRTRLWSVSS